MRRHMGFGLSVVLAVGMFCVTGCQTASAPAPAPALGQQQVEVVIYDTGAKELVHKFVNITGGPTVLQVTQQAAAVQTQVTRTGEEWVTGINGKTSDVAARTLWRYELNTGLPTTAPNLKQVNPGDVIRWRLR